MPSESVTKKKSVNLALQGGGAHGAFTWGVLDLFSKTAGGPPGSVWVVALTGNKGQRQQSYRFRKES